MDSVLDLYNQPSGWSFTPGKHFEVFFYVHLIYRSMQKEEHSFQLKPRCNLGSEMLATSVFLTSAYTRTGGRSSPSLQPDLPMHHLQFIVSVQTSSDIFLLCRRRFEPLTPQLTVQHCIPTLLSYSCSGLTDI